GPAAIADLPWFPIYLVFVFILHPWLGILATSGVAILVAITIATERITGRHIQEQTRLGLLRQGVLDSGVRNAEVARAMGFSGRVAERFNMSSRQLVALQTSTSDITGSLSGASRVLRAMLQSAVLGLGAYLTIKGQMSAGAIIAASIAASRALAPIELA
ncbi:MAG TPA: type I secretion system permease/ATPase, partial [Hyphomicrobiaceae bacterium]|nr:type I secretion system permease/ATPase [Hyphomicrobiaceae bacterium]